MKEIRCQDCGELDSIPNTTFHNLTDKEKANYLCEDCNEEQVEFEANNNQFKDKEMEKEKKFLKRLKRLSFDGGILQKIYWSIDNNGDVLLDEECILEEFKGKLDEVKNILDIP